MLLLALRLKQPWQNSRGTMELLVVLPQPIIAGPLHYNGRPLSNWQAGGGVTIASHNLLGLSSFSCSIRTIPLTCTSPPLLESCRHLYTCPTSKVVPKRNRLVSAACYSIDVCVVWSIGSNWQAPIAMPSSGLARRTASVSSLLYRE